VRRPPKKALLEEEVLLPSYFLRSIIDDFAIFDIDPRLSKRAVPITGIGELEADGSNLPIVLRNVLSNRDSLRKFSNLMNDVLPFISSFRVDKFADKSLMVSVREAYAPRFSLPASLVSDGTINITALILALFFGDKDVVIIEEPERGIHPALLSKITRMLSDASASKQVLVSTHNPEMVSAAPVERLLLITRDEQGFSQVSRPAAQEHVQAFLQSEIGAGDLFVQNLLAP
jgi:predicted ATPase